MVIGLRFFGLVRLLQFIEFIVLDFILPNKKSLQNFSHFSSKNTKNHSKPPPP